MIGMDFYTTSIPAAKFATKPRLSLEQIRTFLEFEISKSHARPPGWVERREQGKCFSRLNQSFAPNRTLIHKLRGVP
jgi:hypothetical protein